LELESESEWKWRRMLVVASEAEWNTRVAPSLSVTVYKLTTQNSLDADLGCCSARGSDNNKQNSGTKCYFRPSKGFPLLLRIGRARILVLRWEYTLLAQRFTDFNNINLQGSVQTRIKRKERGVWLGACPRRD